MVSLPCYFLICLTGTIKLISKKMLSLHFIIDSTLKNIIMVIERTASEFVIRFIFAGFNDYIFYIVILDCKDTKILFTNSIFHQKCFFNIANYLQ